MPKHGQAQGAASGEGEHHGSAPGKRTRTQDLHPPTGRTPKPAAVVLPTRFYDDEELIVRAREMVAAAQCGDHGLFSKWLNFDLSIYRPGDWRVFIDAIDGAGQKELREYSAETCAPGLIAKLATTAPKELVAGGIELPPPEPKKEAAPKKDAHADPHADAHADPHAAAQAHTPAPKAKPNVPFEGVAPGIAAKDALSIVHASGDARCRELAKQLVERSFEKCAMALEGPAIGGDPKLIAAFIASYTEQMNAAIDENNRIMQVLDASGLGGGSKPIPRVAYPANDVATIDGIIADRFGSGLKTGYLQQLVRDGKSSPLWRARLALGLVQSSLAAQDEEVVHIVLEAPPQLARFGLTWSQFWDPLARTLEKKLSSWHHHSLIRRLQAFSNVQLAEAELHAAEDSAKQSEHDEERLVRHARRKERLAKAHHKHAKHASEEHAEAKEHAKEAKEQHEKEVEAKEHAAQERQIEYLVSLIVNLRDELNELEPEALAEVMEWAHENEALRDRAGQDKRVTAVVDKKIKKPRDRVFLLRVLRGDVGGKLAADAKTRGLELDPGAAEELVQADAMMERERAKKALGKGKHHANLKAALISMSPDAREAYLARAVGKTAAQLADRPTRHDALDTFAVQLVEVGLSEKDAQEIAALFRLPEAGEHYAKLRALVMTAEEKDLKTKAFGKRALALVVELRGPELAQVRADDTVRTILGESTEGKAIKAVLGDDSLLPVAPSGEQIQQAIDDAELEPAHWIVLLDHELDKTRVPLPAVARQHRNQIHMIAHRAQQAAERREHRDVVKHADKRTTAVAFMQSVWAGLQHQTYFKIFYPTLAGKMRAGTPITVDDVLDEVLFHDGPLRLAGHGGPAFYTHVNKDDFVQAVLETQGIELLASWSNIEQFRNGLAEAQRRDAGSVKPRKPADGDDAHDEAPPDPKQHERAFRHQFVLDVRDDRKALVKKAVGNASAPDVLRQLRDGLKTAAESDADFKGALDREGINSLFHRERIAMRGAIEQANKRRRGWQLHGVSSKGTADSQNQRELIGDLRRADKDLQTVPDGEHREHDQDELYQREHQAALAHDQEALERSGISFTKLRRQIRKYTELAITIAIMVIATAIAVGITAGTYGAGSVTLGAVALIWAKLGIMLAAKLTAVAITAFVNQAVGNAITGDEWDGRAVATDLMANAAGTALGGVAGAGVDSAIAIGGAITNEVAKEVLKVVATAGAKALAKDGVKAMMEQNRGDVTMTKVLVDVANTEVTSIAAGLAALGMSGELQAAAAKEHEKEVSGEVGTHHDAVSPHDGHTTPSTQADHLGEMGHDQLHGVELGLDHTGHDVDALSHDGSIDATGHAELATAHTDIEHAHEALASHDVAGAQAHLADAQHQLELARAHTADGSAAQAHIDAAQDQLDQAHDHLTEAKENLELQEKFEHAEADAQAAEDLAKKLAYVAKPADFALEKLFDAALDSVEEAIDERRKEAGELREKKLEHAEETGEHRAHEAHAKHAAHAAHAAHTPSAHTPSAHASTAHASPSHAAASHKPAQPKPTKPALTSALKGSRAPKQQHVRFADASNQKKGAAAKGGRGATGVVNVGASCYLSSILNTLAVTPPYRALFHGARPDGLEDLRDMIDTALTNIEHGAQVSRRSIDAMIDELYEQGMYGEDAGDAEKARQHDASEMLRWILDKFTSGARVGNVAVTQDTSNDYRAAHLQAIHHEHPDQLSQMPLGRVVHEAPHPELIVELPIDHVGDLAGALRKYSAPEAVEMSVREGGRAKQGIAQRSTTLSGTPLVVTFALKRFTARMVDDQPVLERDAHEVAMPEEFDFGGRHYRLQAMIQHHAGKSEKSPSSGHYTAVTHTDQGWIRNDDTNVHAEADAGASRKLGYIYTYVREG